MVKVVVVMVANICPLRETRCPRSGAAFSLLVASSTPSMPAFRGLSRFALVAAYTRGAPNGQYMARV